MTDIRALREAAERAKAARAALIANQDSQDAVNAFDQAVEDWCELANPTTIIGLLDRLKEAEEALGWYQATVGNCRKLTSEGDAARSKLHDDCGERARAALEAAERAAWRPISEAPKDGSWFLALQDGETYPCQFHEEEPEECAGRKGWLDLFNRSFEEPTHFRPLPTPPEAA